MKTLKNIGITLIIAILTIFCTACGTSDPEIGESVNIAFIVGIADGEPKFNDGIAELSALPAQSGTDYAFISVEGNPTTIGEVGTIPNLSDRCYTDIMMNRVRDGIKADLIERLTSYKPATTEIDIATATEVAVRTLNANAVDGRSNVLVYYCGGKSTTGLINMLETPVYKLDVEASVINIANKMHLDMHDVDEVIWYCCGEFGGENQPTLNSTEKAKLQAFYTKLFVALGMDESHIKFKNDIPRKEYYQFPDCQVSCMPVEGTENGLQEFVVLDPEIFEKADEAILETPIVIPEDQVQFEPNSALFKDSDLAVESLRPIADFMLEYPNRRILLYSTCAGDVDCKWLSDARSENVKNVLCAAGVDESRIKIVSVSIHDDPYYKLGLGTDTEACVVNRKTVICDLQTELAVQILAKEH